MPPEMFVKACENPFYFYEVDKVITKESDVFSAGFLFWEILTIREERHSSCELKFELYKVYQKDISIQDESGFHSLKNSAPSIFSSETKSKFLMSKIYSESELPKSSSKVRFPDGWSGWSQAINASQCYTKSRLYTC